MSRNPLTEADCATLETRLRTNPLFSRLNADQLADMCRNSRLIDLGEGEILFHHGDAVENFFFVSEGLIKLYRQSAFGNEKIIELADAGRTFAEALMLYEHPNYPVNAAAMKRSTVVAINARWFNRLLSRAPETCMMLMGDLSRRLHELINEIEQLSLLTGRNRVATYLLDQSMNKGAEFKLDIPKNAIASMLSLQPESFSRLLKEFCNSGLIRVDDCHISVIDNAGLRRVAGLN